MKLKNYMDSPWDVNELENSLPFSVWILDLLPRPSSGVTGLSTRFGLNGVGSRLEPTTFEISHTFKKPLNFSGLGLGGLDDSNFLPLVTTAEIFL